MSLGGSGGSGWLWLDLGGFGGSGWIPVDLGLSGGICVVLGGSSWFWVGPFGRNFIFNNEIPEEILFTFVKKLSLRANNARFKL